MSVTNVVEVSGSAPIQAAAGVSWAFIQIQGSGPVVVHVSSNNPGPGFPGIILKQGHLEEIGFTALEVGDVIFLRPFNADVPSYVTVVKPGT